VSSEGAIEVEGRIVEVLAAMLFRVELVNGHRLVAHVPEKLRLVFERLSLGDGVRVKLSPYDLSRGSITTREE
jgi:translation initiation factor IF-1